jgi:hypothetical protein
MWVSLSLSLPFCPSLCLFPLFLHSFQTKNKNITSERILYYFSLCYVILELKSQCDFNSFEKKLCLLLVS